MTTLLDFCSYSAETSDAPTCGSCLQSSLCGWCSGVDEVDDQNMNGTCVSYRDLQSVHMRKSCRRMQTEECGRVDDSDVLLFGLAISGIAAVLLCYFCVCLKRNPRWRRRRINPAFDQGGEEGMFGSEMASQGRAAMARARLPPPGPAPVVVVDATGGGEDAMLGVEKHPNQ